MKVGPYLTPCSEVNSKWIKDMNVRPETKIPRRKQVISSSALVLVMAFLGLARKAKEIKVEISK